MRLRDKRGIVVGVGMAAIAVLCGLAVMNALAADPIVGQWNYTTSNHWAKGPVPAGSPSTGVLVIAQSGDQYTMEFKSGMVFNPPELKNFTGTKDGKEYVFSNSARVDNEGGVAKNTCTLQMTGANQCEGESFSQYSNAGVVFSWGFDIRLTR